VALKGSKLPTGVHKAHAVNNKYLKDDSVKEILKKFLATAQKEKIQVYVIVSPTTKYYSKSSIPDIQQITSSYGFNFFDFSHPEGFEQNSLFRDATHLNHEGAVKFTNLLINKLKANHSTNSIAVPSANLLRRKRANNEG